MQFRIPFFGPYPAGPAHVDSERSVARTPHRLSSTLSVVVFMATIFLVASSGRCADESSYEDDIVAVSIEPVAEGLHPGDRVVLKLKIFNKSSHNIRFGRSPVERVYRLTCARDEVPATLTHYGVERYGMLKLVPEGNFKAIGVFPSEAREYEIEASRIYDMSKAGKYTLMQQLTLHHDVPGNPVRLHPEQLKVQVELVERRE